MNFRLYFVVCVLSYRFSSGQRLVSRGKTISSSSFVRTWSADKAVDGDARRAPNDCDCCAATDKTYEPWYKLDLGQQYKIHSISVLGRGGTGDGARPFGYGHTLKNMQIKLGTTHSNEEEITHYTGNDYTYNFPLPIPKNGRYLTLTLLRTTQFFVICELSVYAVCDGNTYGPDCVHTCGNCIDGETCDTVNGKCPDCATGYKAPLCQECDNTYHGNSCTQRCFCINGPCEKSTGICPTGGCSEGYKGNQCNTPCGYGEYGRNCSEACGSCYNNATCDKFKGSCQGCAPGFMGSNCQHECHDGFFGYNCTQTCFCLNSTCNKETGICPAGGCKEGYKGNKCDTPCVAGKYGRNCEEDCGSCYNNETCDVFSGSCEKCAPGYRELQCKQICGHGTYGQDCGESCGFCYNNETCNHVDGNCSRCSAGYKGANCTEECDSRRFGLNCSRECGHCLSSVQCNIVNGTCPAGCDPGFDGLLCKAKCDKGKYGEKCANSCGNCYQQDTCDAVTGLCTNNCSAGYTGTYCKEECENGTYGLGCLKECGQCLDGNTCDKRNGTCTECEPGYIHPLCKVLSYVVPPDTTPSVAPIIGAVVGVVVLAAICILAVILYRRRRNENNAKTAIAAIPSFADIDENQSNGISAAQKAPLYAEVEKEKPSTAKKPDEPKNTEEEDIYYAFLSKRTDLKICQLWDYIHLKKRDENLLFYQEYNRLPGELKYPCDEAKKAKHAGKNRYRGLYAYDRTRVPLTIEEAGEGEYINASFIHGFEKQKKFIASQGPTENMRTDFWRMVWQQKSKSIVMLTNLTELGAEKCILYWPEAGEVTHGNITIRHVSEEVTVDFTIRQFEIFKGNDKNRLPVTQYHFQAWPDKSTPDSTWCLVKFWIRVMQDTANMADSGPIVVHCSAGIGRTGTFIALDNAYNQAKIEGTVRILDMVTTIREQRVKMVQTRDQYVYLHEAVADALLFGTHFVWSSQFEELYEYLTDAPPKSRISRLQTQFNLIVESVQDKTTVHTTVEETDNEYSNVFIHGKHQQQVSIDEYRPKSKSQKYVREVGALILQNHEDKGAFMICKSPAESNLSEFWSLVQEQNIKTIVSLSYSKNLSLGLSNKMIQTKFGLSQTEERKTQTFTESKISLSDDMGVSYFQYKNWSSGDNVPKDARSMVQFVEAILDSQRRLSDTEPVLVYCNDGVKQSGLLCVLLSEFNRINRAGGHINIIQTVKMMKDRNVDIVENFDQYRYIYDVILARLHESTYQNQ